MFFVPFSILICARYVLGFRAVFAFSRHVLGMFRVVVVAVVVVAVVVVIVVVVVICQGMCHICGWVVCWQLWQQQ